MGDHVGRSLRNVGAANPRTHSVGKGRNLTPSGARVELESLQCELRLVRGQCKAAEAKNEALEQRERSRAETEEAEEAEPDASTVAAFFGSQLEEALVRALPSSLCPVPT